MGGGLRADRGARAAAGAREDEARARLTRPLLLLDVDGVLLPLGTGRRDGYEPASAGPFAVWVLSALRDAVPALARAFDVRWLTSWNDDANLEVAPLFGLPPLPVLHVAAHYRKLEVVRGAALAGRAVAWVDDRLEPAAWEWSEARAEPTLLVEPDPGVGLTPAEVERLLGFAAATPSGRP